MNCNEKFKNELLANVEGIVNDDALISIKKSIEELLYKYNVQENETSIVPYEYETPQLLKTYLAVKKIEGRSPLTLKNYYYIISKFFQLARKNVEEITVDDLRKFIYLELDKVSGVTVEKHRQYLKNFFNWSYQNGYIPKDPSIQLAKIKHEKKERCYLTRAEFEKLFDACKNERERAIVMVLYSTGCRVTELCNLKKNDLHLSSRTVDLFGKGRKERVGFLNERAVICLEKYFESRTDSCDYVFVSAHKCGSSTSNSHKVTRGGIEKTISVIAKRTDIKKNITPHVIRHTTATLSLQSGMTINEISEMLGHEDISTTMIYAKTSKESVRVSHQRFVV